MLRITAIQKAKKGGYHLFIEEEYALTISAEVLAETGLAVGQQITPQRLDEIRQICDRRRARERALYLLESRSHSEKELYDKLCRSVPEQIAADVTCRMVELGLVDDGTYARRWAAMLWQEKKYGPRRIRQSMMQKGFDRDLIDECWRKWPSLLRTKKQSASWKRSSGGNMLVLCRMRIQKVAAKR